MPLWRPGRSGRYRPWGGSRDCLLRPLNLIRFITGPLPQLHIVDGQCRFPVSDDLWRDVAKGKGLLPTIASELAIKPKPIGLPGSRWLFRTALKKSPSGKAGTGWASYLCDGKRGAKPAHADPIVCLYQSCCPKTDARKSPSGDDRMGFICAAGRTQPAHPMRKRSTAYTGPMPAANDRLPKHNLDTANERPTTCRVGVSSRCLIR